MARELINQIQIYTREQAGLSNYDPARYPVIHSSLSENVAAFDPSPPSLRCNHCHGNLLGEGLLCMYCFRLNDVVACPDPILFKLTIGYSWLLHSLNLHGSEMVEPHDGKNQTPRTQGSPKDKISLSELLNFQISWREETEQVEHDVKNKEVEQKNSLSLWNGIELDDFFLESERERGSSMSDQHVIGAQVQFTTHEDPYVFQNVPPAAKAVASNAGKDHEFSGWQADFQPADTGVQNTSQLYGNLAVPPVDLSTHIDSTFDSGKDSKDEISINCSILEDWTSDELRNNLSSEAFPQSVHFNVSQRGDNSQMQNKVEKPSTSGDWFQSGEWGINNMDQPNKGITTDGDNTFAEWNDFTSFSNVQDPSGSVFVESNIPGAISQEKPSDLTLPSFDDKHNDMDISKFGGADLFSDSFTKNDDILEADNLPAGTSSSDRLVDLTSVVEDADEHDAINVENPNAGTNTKEGVRSLTSEMHDLSFMLKDDLTVPSKSADSNNFSF